MWLFFGWGTKSKNWDIGNGQFVVMTWRYFHLFLMPIGYGVSYHVIGDSRSEDREVSRGEAESLCGRQLSIGVWNRFGLLLSVAYVVAASFLAVVLPPFFYIAVPLGVIGLSYALFEEQKWRSRYFVLWIISAIGWLVWGWLYPSEPPIDSATIDIINAAVIVGSVIAVVILWVWMRITQEREAVPVVPSSPLSAEPQIVPQQ